MDIGRISVVRLGRRTRDGELHDGHVLPRALRHLPSDDHDGEHYLARDLGAKVGIGTTSPSNQLSVSGNANVTGSIAAGGSVQVGAYASDPPGANGMIYYNKTKNAFRGYQNGGWGDLIPAVPAGAKQYTTTCTAVATDGSGCTETLGTAGLTTASPTSTYTDNNACGTMVDPCAGWLPSEHCHNGPPYWSSSVVSCTAANTPVP